MAMYENDMVWLCETPSAFIGAFCYTKNHFHPSGPFKLIKTMLKSLYVLLGLSPLWNCYPRVVTRKGLPSVQYSRMMILKIEFAKNKCLSTIWSTEKIPVAWTYPAREHYKNVNFL